MKVLIDSTGFYYRNYHALKNLEKDGVKVGGMYGYLRNLNLKFQKLGIRWKGTYHVFDSLTSRNKKTKVYSEYKGNRKKMSDPNFWQVLSELKEVITGLGGYVVSHKDYEADEIIAYLARKFSESGEDKIYIFSDDKDLAQLLEYPNVELITTKKHYTKEEFEKEYGVVGKDWTIVKALSGDPSDNIPQVISGLGYGKAVELVKSGTFEAYKSSEQFQINYKLVNLLDVEIPDLQIETNSQPDWERALQILQKYNMHSLYIIIQRI